jgi:hypothetical protein
LEGRHRIIFGQTADASVHSVLGSSEPGDRRECVERYEGGNELTRSYERRAKRLLGLASVAEAHTGTVTFIQRFHSALRLNVHAHTLVLDGVYIRNAGSAELHFESLPAPSVEEVQDVARRTAAVVGVCVMPILGRAVALRARRGGAAHSGLQTAPRTRQSSAEGTPGRYEALVGQPN